MKGADVQFDGELFAITGAIFSGLFQALKRPVGKKRRTLPQEYYLFVIMMLGPIIGVLIGVLRSGDITDWNQNAMMGLVAGLMSAGLYSGVSTVVKAQLASESLPLQPDTAAIQEAQRIDTSITETEDDPYDSDPRTPIAPAVMTSIAQPTARRTRGTKGTT